MPRASSPGCRHVGENRILARKLLPWNLSYILTDVVEDGAVARVADPLSSGAVEVPALAGEVTADDHRVAAASLHPAVVRRRRRRATDSCALHIHSRKSGVQRHDAITS